MRNVAAAAVVLYHLMINSDSGLLFWATL